MTPRCLALCLALAGSTMLAGCSAWPEEGGGGLAELRSPSDPVLVSLDQRLQTAIAAGSRHFAAAKTAEAELQLTRARRSYSAGFEADALSDVAELEKTLSDIESRLRRPAPAKPARS